MTFADWMIGVYEGRHSYSDVERALAAAFAAGAATEHKRWHAEIEPFLVAAADGSMSRNNSEALVGELLEWVRRA